MKGDKTLVVGATGLLGMQVVRGLRDAGVTVRAMVRPTATASKRDFVRVAGAESIYADLKDPASLAAACDAVTTVVSTATSITSRQDGDAVRTVDEEGYFALIDAAERSGVAHFVFISIPPLETDFAYQRAKRKVEARLRESKMSSTILQPGPFIEIWLGPAFGFDPVRGVARVFGSGEQGVSWISVEDVARFAVSAATSDSLRGAVLPLGGPEPLSAMNVIRIFEAFGTPTCRVENVPEDALRAMAANARDAIEEASANLALATAMGLRIDPAPALQLLPGRMTSVRDYARQLVASR
jgi:uncharacterized protein YbjT (DUF2867 family)